MQKGRSSAARVEDPVAVPMTAPGRAYWAGQTAAQAGRAPAAAEIARFRSPQSAEEINRQSLKGGGIMMGAQAIRFVVQMASTMVFARLLTPHDFGYIAMVTAVTGFVALLQDGNLSMVTVQRTDITHEQVSTLFWINVALSLAIMLVVAMLAPAIAWFYREPRLVWITLALSVTFFFGGLNVQHQALLKRQMQFKRLALIDVTGILTGFAIGVLMARYGFGYWSLVGVTFGSSMTNWVMTWAICRWRPCLPTRTSEIRSMMAFGGRLTGFQVLTHFTRNFDNVVIGRVLGSVALGIYSKAYALLALPINQINVPLSSVVLPALSRLQHRPEEYSKFYLRALRTLGLFTLPLVVFSSIFARDVVLVLLGKQWLPAATVFQLLAPAALVGAVNIAPGWLCISLDKSRLQLIYGAISAPVCVLAFLIGVKWGTEGVATGFSLTYTLLFWAFVHFATRNSPVRFSQVFGAFAMPLLASTVVATMVWIWRWDFLSSAVPALALVSSAALFVAGYFLVALLFTQTRTLIAELLHNIDVQLGSNLSVRLVHQSHV
jgi:O-antigen/teichoic acid export membrane protein